MNPSAQRQITQYAASVTELFKLMTEGKEAEFATRIHAAGKFVFGDKKDERPGLLRDDLLDQFSLSGVPKAERVPNNQLALLAMVDCWWKLGLNPYDHMICSTPVTPNRPVFPVLVLLGEANFGDFSVVVGNHRVFVPTA
jgi:prephenate dehydrogenase (NADP+)